MTAVEIIILTWLFGLTLLVGVTVVGVIVLSLRLGALEGKKRKPRLARAKPVTDGPAEGVS